MNVLKVTELYFKVLILWHVSYISVKLVSVKLIKEKDRRLASPVCLPHLCFPLAPLRSGGMPALPEPLGSTGAASGAWLHLGHGVG